MEKPGLRGWKVLLALMAVAVLVAACGADEADDPADVADVADDDADEPAGTDDPADDPADDADADADADDPADPPQLSQDTLEMQSIAQMASVPVWVAAEEGFYGARGLTVSFEPLGTVGSAIEAVAAGQIDITGGGLASHGAAVQAGGSGRQIFQAQEGTDVGVGIRQSIADELGMTDPDSMENFELLAGASGLRWGATRPGGTPDIMFNVFLGEVGVLEDNEIVNLQDFREIIAQFQAGNIDAYGAPPPLLFEPDDAFIMPLGMIHPQYAGTPVNFNWVASEPFLENHPDTIQAWVTATWEGQLFAMDPANRERVLEIMAVYLPDSSPEDLENMFEFSGASLASDPCIEEDGFYQALEVANLGRETPLTITYEQIVDNTFCETAKQEVGQ